MDVARAFPHMKVIVQDAPEVVAQGPEVSFSSLHAMSFALSRDVCRPLAQQLSSLRSSFVVLIRRMQYWKTNLPEGNVSFVPIDFFKQSPVSGCEYYYVKHILCVAYFTVCCALY